MLERLRTASLISISMEVYKKGRDFLSVVSFLTGAEPSRQGLLKNRHKQRSTAVVVVFVASFTISCPRGRRKRKRENSSSKTLSSLLHIFLCRVTASLRRERSACSTAILVSFYVDMHLYMESTTDICMYGHLLELVHVHIGSIGTVPHHRQRDIYNFICTSFYIDLSTTFFGRATDNIE